MVADICSFCGKATHGGTGNAQLVLVDLSVGHVSVLQTASIGIMPFTAQLLQHYINAWA